MSTFVTGEAVALDLRPAALPSRVLAGAVDALLQIALGIGLGALILRVAAGASEAASGALFIVLLVTLLVGYPVTFETVLRGRTPGKAVLGLRVVRDDGGPIGFRHALVRGMTGAFVERPGVTFFSGAVLCSLLNPQGKRLGDLLAGTLVLQERVPGRGQRAPDMPPHLAGWAATLDLAGLTDELALSMRTFVSRAPSMTARAREDLGGRLVASVLAAVRPAPPAGTPGWAVLAAVLAERRRREQSRQPTWLPATGPGPTPAPVAPAAASPAAAPVRTPSEPPSAGPGGFAPPG
ncbi:MAG TPA: RDD family protein [Mycobacteriales bacterium]|nr:RDD family protein [Mycobacteriales bacterium]